MSAVYRASVAEWALYGRIQQKRALILESKNNEKL